MPHFIAKLPLLESNPHKPLESALDSKDSKDSRPAYVLASLRHKNLRLIAMPYEYQSRARLCFLQEIVRERDVLVKGIKALRPLPCGILKNALKALSTHYDLLQDNLSQTTLRQEADSPFFLSDRELLALVDAKSQTKKQVLVEIGFGSGRHIVHLARTQPHALVIGLEIHAPSIEQVLRQIDLLGLENLYLAALDARQFLSCVRSGGLGGIFIHFPVPWNTAKSRRVLSDKILREALRALRVEGFLEFRTDDREYFCDVLDMAENLPSAHCAHTINTQQAITSKYEARWRKQQKDIYTITVTPSLATRTQGDSGCLGEGALDCDFGFDEGLMASVFCKLSALNARTDGAENLGTIFAGIWERRRFERGFLCIYDMYIAQGAAGDRVAFLVHFGDFSSSCARLVVFERGCGGYLGRYFPDIPIASPANCQAHEVFTTILERL